MGGIAKGIGTLAGTAVGGPLLGAAIGGGLGAVKHNQQMGEYNRQKQLAADTARYSPWTGMNAAQFMPQNRPSSFEDIGGGAFGGLMQGSSWNKAAEAEAAKAAAEKAAMEKSAGSVLGGAMPMGASAGGFSSQPSLFNPYGGKIQSSWGSIG